MGEGIDEKKDELIGGWMDGWMDEWMDEWMDGRLKDVIEG